jgi:hypothetical protein
MDWTMAQMVWRRQLSLRGLQVITIGAAYALAAGVPQ